MHYAMYTQTLAFISIVGEAVGGFRIRYICVSVCRYCACVIP